jgi:hypothetical protein
MAIKYYFHSDGSYHDGTFTYDVVNGSGARPHEYKVKINIIKFVYIYYRSCVWERRRTVEGEDKFYLLNTVYLLITLRCTRYHTFENHDKSYICVSNIPLMTSFVVYVLGRATSRLI